jgi:NTE family protein
MLRDRRYSLVLGGGGIKGLAHIGVLKAIEETDSLPQELVGSSIGALVGAAWCAGTSASELEELALAVTRRDLFRVAHRNMALQRMRAPGLYRREPLRDLIGGLLGDTTFGELRVPLRVNTVDLNAGEQVLWGAPGFDDVLVADAVYASCALPGYLPPQALRGRHFADGASVSNLPFEIVAHWERDLVIAVDVGRSVPHREDMSQVGFAALYARAIEIAMETMRDRSLRHWTSPPMLLLSPRVEHLGLFSFTANDYLVNEGHAVASSAFTTPEAVPASDAAGVVRYRVPNGITAALA